MRIVTVAFPVRFLDEGLVLLCMTLRWPTLESRRLPLASRIEKPKDSKYAQVASGVEGVATRPLVGLASDLKTRAVEWLAFHSGGPAGKLLSLAIRQIGAAATNGLIAIGRLASARRSE